MMLSALFEAVGFKVICYRNKLNPNACIFKLNSLVLSSGDQNILLQWKSQIGNLCILTLEDLFMPRDSTCSFAFLEVLWYSC